MTSKHVAVLAGGLSTERPISLSSGRACAAALEEESFRLSFVDVGRDVAGVLARFETRYRFQRAARFFR